MTVTSDVALVNACGTTGDWTGNTHAAPVINNLAATPFIALEPDFLTASCMKGIAVLGTNGSWHENTDIDLTNKLLVWWVWTGNKQETSFIGKLAIKLHEGANRTGDNAEWEFDLVPINAKLGGWFPLTLWPTQPDTETGTFVPADTSCFELVLNNTGARDVKFFGWDYIHYLSKLLFSGTTPTTHDLDDLFDHNTVALLGVMTKSIDSFTCQVTLEMGATATTTTFAETNASLQFLPANSDHKIGFNFINPTSGSNSFTLGELSGGNPINGCIISYDPALTGATDSSDVFTNPGNCATFKLYDSTFINCRDINLPTSSANREVIGCKFSDCGQINVSTCQFEDNVIVNAKDVGVLISSTSHETKNNNYIGCGHAISFDTAGTYTIDGDQFTGNTFDFENTSGGLVTINLINGANGSTVDNVGGGSTTVINTPVSVKVTAEDADTQTGVQGARVFLQAAAGGDLPSGASVTITRSGSTATVNHTAHGLFNGDKVVIRGADQSEYNGIQTISNVTTNSYDYTVSGTPTTPATGTITSTAVILDGTTDSNGEVEDAAFNFTGNQPVSGRVRKGTASTFYKTAAIVGTITSSGFDFTVFLIPDE